MNGGKFYLRVLAGFAVLEGVSYLTFGHTTITSYVLALLAVGLFVVAWRRPAIIAYAAVAELLVGSKGYLLAIHVSGVDLSLRLVLFLVTVAVVVFRWKHLASGLPPRRAWLPPASLLLWVGWSTVWGLLQHYPASRVFFDMNAFLFLPAMAMWWVLLRTDEKWRDRLWGIALAGVTMLGLKSWLMIVLFGLDLSWISHVYHWIRQTGVGEVTYISPGVYRVFFQSQIYGLLVGLVVLGRGRMSHWARWWWIPWVAACLAVWASLSRSYWWLGLGSAALTFLFLVLSKRMWRGWSRTIWRVVVGVALGYFLFNWAVHFPYPISIHGGKADAVVARFQNAGTGDASTARKNQIQPLLSEIRGNPIIGRGFGATVRYYSTDPRIRGWRETDAFELGYLDLWLKIGLVGLALFAWWGWTLLRESWRSRWSVILLPSVVALAAIHVTSPYLNHPLGLGWLALVSLLLYV